MKLIIQVEPEALESARHRAARKIAQKTKIPGFRPGKAPYNVILRTIGEASIFEEAIEILANELYPKAIDEAEIEPYGPGQFQNITSMDPLTLEFMVPLEAEVTLGEYHDIRLPYESPIITDADVDRVLNDLRERQAVITPAERPVMETDQVTIKLSAVRKNVEEGDNPTLFEERSTTVNVRKSDEEIGNEWPYPGFSKQLIGLSRGEGKSVSYTYPEDSEWETLRVQEAVFKFTVEAVKSRVLPDANDEFAHSVGKYENMEALLKDIRSSLEEQAHHEYNENYNQKIIAELVKGGTIKYPPQMLELEIKSYIDQLENRLAQQRLDLETYLKTRQMDNKALEEEVKPLAEERLKQTLVLFKVARQENITVTNEEIEAESAQALAHLSKQMTPDQAKKAINEGYIRNLVGNISTDMLVRRTYERLQSIAQGKYQTVEASAEPTPEPIAEALEVNEADSSEAKIISEENAVSEE